MNANRLGKDYWTPSTTSVSKFGRVSNGYGTLESLVKTFTSKTIIVPFICYIKLQSSNCEYKNTLSNILSYTFLNDIM